jgi:bis(5'-nucleosidyl)-tetraphosphatase
MRRFTNQKFNRDSNGSADTQLDKRYSLIDHQQQIRCLVYYYKRIYINWRHHTNAAPGEFVYLFSFLYNRAARKEQKGARMTFEKSAGAVVFYRGKQTEYLLLHSSYWGFPKGHMENGEDEHQTALREVREEAGLDVIILDGFREVDAYSFRRKGEPVEKQSVYFVAQARERNARLSHEHDDMAWLSFDEALARLGYEGGREILRKANDFLTRKT